METLREDTYSHGFQKKSMANGSLYAQEMIKLKFQNHQIFNNNNRYEAGEEHSAAFHLIQDFKSRESRQMKHHTEKP